MSDVHPLVVHFPIALLLVAFGLEVLGLVLKNERIAYAATWNLGLGALGAIAAVITGLRAAGSAAIAASEEGLLQTHKTLGLVAMGVAVVLAAWRLGSRGEMSRGARAVFMALMLGMAIVLAIGAHYGGKLVY
jgi:uncharacterized membrane protein